MEGMVIRMTRTEQFKYLAKLYERMGDYEAAELCRQELSEAKTPTNICRKCGAVRLRRAA